MIGNFDFKIVSEEQKAKIVFFDNNEVESDGIFDFIFNYNNMKNDGIEGEAHIFYKNFFIDKIYSFAINKEYFIFSIKQKFYQKFYSGAYKQYKNCNDEISVDFIKLFNKQNLISFLDKINQNKHIKNEIFKNLKNGNEVAVPFYSNGIINKKIPFGLSFSTNDYNEKKAIYNNISFYYNNNHSFDDIENLIEHQFLINKYKIFFDYLKKNNIEMYLFKCFEKNNFPLYKFYFLDKKANVTTQQRCLSFKYLCTNNILKDFYEIIISFDEKYDLFINEAIAFFEIIKKYKKISYEKNKYNYNSIDILIYKKNISNKYITISFIPEYSGNIESDNELEHIAFNIKKLFLTDDIDCEKFKNIDFRKYMKERDMFFENDIINTYKEVYLEDKYVSYFFNVSNSNFLIHKNNYMNIIHHYETYFYAVYCLLNGYIKDFSSYLNYNDIIVYPHKVASDNIIGKRKNFCHLIHPFISALLTYMLYLNDENYSKNLIFDNILSKLFEKDIVNELRECLLNPQKFFTTDKLFINNTKSNLLEEIL